MRVYLFCLICIVSRDIISPVAGRAPCVLRRCSVAHSRKQRSKKCFILPAQHLKTTHLIRRWSKHQRFFCHRFPSHRGPVRVEILLCRLFSRVLLLRGSSKLSGKHLRHAFSSVFVRWEYFSPSPARLSHFSGPYYSSSLNCWARKYNQSPFTGFRSLVVRLRTHPLAVECYFPSLWYPPTQKLTPMWKTMCVRRTKKISSWGCQD